jgi:hypothetical protein
VEARTYFSLLKSTIEGEALDTPMRAFVDIRCQRTGALTLPSHETS